jgi:hypothetical protein
MLIWAPVAAADEGGGTRAVCRFEAHVRVVKGGNRVTPGAVRDETVVFPLADGGQMTLSGTFGLVLVCAPTAGAAGTGSTARR